MRMEAGVLDLYCCEVMFSQHRYRGEKIFTITIIIIVALETQVEKKEK